MQTEQEKLLKKANLPKKNLVPLISEKKMQKLKDSLS